MKKISSIVLIVVMMFCMVGCGTSSADRESSATDNNTYSNIDNSTGNGTDNEAATDESTQTQVPAESNEEEVTETPQRTTNILVAYFSATNTTKGVAEKIANGLQADIYQIMPEEPYTEADLDYNDSNSRSTVEMNDKNLRPGISGKVENMDQYDVVFLGYPIWWGDAPRIVSTFMESYDFLGKTIIPFCTSGGSGIASSATNLQALTSDATWIEGKRFGANDSEDTIMEWVNSLEVLQQ